eukprot:CAMPEP_0182454750 /NCGR_PEP_ID=MMETSP1319-20130603/1241_1 /TAXON_ID=172717 /ORGANISM="Bolidomonas pacifica, Strain RCC208" /LENGTH=268 /DNA_ID=CAMNT_0024652771 /DNA_START=14 /DNA_END=817 /DNA_ORIENTATION=+
MTRRKRADEVDSDPEDEDYAPDPSESSNSGPSASLPPSAPLVGIPASKKSKIDDLWSSMNAPPPPASSGTSPGSALRSVPKKSACVSKAKSLKAKKARRRASRIIADVLCTAESEALAFVDGAAAAKRRRGGEGKGRATARDDDAVKSEVAKGVKGVKVGKKRVTTTRRFAGSDIEVTEVVDGSEGEGAGVDTVLDAMKGPAKLSTIGKTCIDWENLKNDSRDIDKDELEKRARDGYLDRKEFLGRVDGRRFEIERGERERDRAKRKR